MSSAGQPGLPARDIQQETVYHVHDDREWLVDSDIEGEVEPEPQELWGHGDAGGLTSRDTEDAYHCHCPRKPGTTKARNQLIAVSVLCVVFMIAEIIGEYMYMEK